MIDEFYKHYLQQSAEGFNEVRQGPISFEEYLDESQSAFICGAAMMFAATTELMASDASQEEKAKLLKEIHAEFQELIGREDASTTGDTETDTRQDPPGQEATGAA